MQRLRPPQHMASRANTKRENQPLAAAQPLQGVSWQTLGAGNVSWRVTSTQLLPAQPMQRLRPPQHIMCYRVLTPSLKSRELGQQTLGAGNLSQCTGTCTAPSLCQPNPCNGCLRHSTSSANTKREKQPLAAAQPLQGVSWQTLGAGNLPSWVLGQQPASNPACASPTHAHTRTHIRSMQQI
jgi:hypothetical protein